MSTEKTYNGWTNYATWHGIQEQDKLDSLVASMAVDGWLGAPLVADNDQLLTGSHRWVAAELAGIEAPVIDIRELVAGWDTLIDETGLTNYEVAVAEVIVHEVPDDIKTAYGIDIH